jgi:pimeloyl-ACP methyl ester carboxylesterase
VASRISFMAMPTTQFLQRPEGRIGYDVAGSGPLVVCLPAMGELRQSFRHLVPLLLDSGFRVATMDLRGHGDSEATFSAYDDEALAGDASALIDELGGPAYLVGNSMGAGASVIVAAARPELVSGLVLVGPFVRNGDVGPIGRLMFRLALTKPWGPVALMAYYPKWLPGQRPDDYEEHRDRVRDNLSRPGHWRAFVQTSRTSHAPAEARLGDVKAPSVVIMGTDDIDWKDPVAEAGWIGERLSAKVTTLAGVGHYPQVQAPAVVVAAVSRLAQATPRA